MRALITGVSGQDGSYLAELLRDEGIEVHGTVRALADRESPNLDAVREAVTLHEVDVLARGALAAVVAALQPQQIYHLAAPTFVPQSWRALADSFDGIAGATAELLEAVRDRCPTARVVVATSREIFGPDAPSPQREDTPCQPASPYGVAKLAAHRLVGLVRDREGLHASSAILFNHESSRRPPEFVTRKVTAAVAAIGAGRERELVLGDLDAVRDWSAATDVVRGLRAMAAAAEPGDYVLASGVGRTVRELVETAFACVGMAPDGRVRIDPELVRAPEREHAIGDPGRARQHLGWEPLTTFEQLIAEMVAADVEALGRP